MAICVYKEGLPSGTVHPSTQHTLRFARPPRVFTTEGDMQNHSDLTNILVAPQAAALCIRTISVNAHRRARETLLGRTPHFHTLVTLMASTKNFPAMRTLSPM